MTQRFNLPGPFWTRPNYRQYVLVKPQPQYLGPTPHAYTQTLNAILEPVSGDASIAAPVQTSAVTLANGASSPTLSSVKSGNTVVACLENGNGLPFFGPAGWVQAITSTNAAVCQAEIWYLSGANNPGGTVNPTFTVSTASAPCRGFITELSGVDPVAPLDKTASANATSSATCSSGTLSGNKATSIAVTCFIEKISANAAVVFTPGSGYTLLASNQAGTGTANHMTGDYRLNVPVGDSETETSDTASIANGWAGCVAAFKIPVAGGSTIGPQKQWQSGTEGNATLNLTGAFGPTSTLKALAATLNFTVVITRAITRGLTATANFIGATAIRTARAVAASVAFKGGTTIANVQLGALIAGTSTVSPTLSTVVARNLVVACISNSVGLEFTSLSAGWVRVTSNALTNRACEIWYLRGVDNAGGTITPTFTTGTGGVTRGFLSEWSGADPTNPLDTFATGSNATSTTCPSGTLSGNDATDLAITCFHEALGSSVTVSFTPDVNYTNIANNGSTASFHHLTGDYRLNVPAGDTETETSSVISTANGWVGIIAAFQTPRTYINKRTGIPGAGTLNLTGTRTSILGKVFPATLSFIGSATKATGRNITANLNFAGAMGKTMYKLFEPIISFVGAFVKLINKPLPATLNFTGLVNRLRALALSASLTFSGARSTIRGIVLNATLNFGTQGPDVEGTWGLLDISGNGLVSPPQTPAMTSTGVTTLPAGTYTVGYTWIRAGFESGLSTTRTVTIAVNTGIHVPAITGIPLGVTAINPYFTVVPAGATVGLLPQQTVTAGTMAAFNILADATTHALPKTGGTVLLQPNTGWTTMVAQPSINGMCVRVGWNVLSDDGVNYDFSILQPYLDSCNSRGVRFALRIMAGQWTPAGYFNGGGNAYNGTNPAGNLTNPGSPGAAKVPYPWAVGGGVNTNFEALYTNFATQAAAYCRSNGVPLLHFANYGFQFSELYFGASVKTGDYTYARFITGHKRLYDIAGAVLGNDLAVEFPMSGTGSLWAAGGTQVDSDLSAYAAIVAGNKPAIFFLQLNGFGPVSNNTAPDATGTAGSPTVTSAHVPGYFASAQANDNITLPGAGAGGSTLNTTISAVGGAGSITLATNVLTSGTYASTAYGGGNNVDGSWTGNAQYGGQHREQNDLDMQAQTYITGIGHAIQMINTSNTYPWNTLYSAITDGPPGPYNIKYLEVYVASDIGGGTSAQLNANIVTFQPPADIISVGGLVKKTLIPIAATVNLSGKIVRAIKRVTSSTLTFSGIASRFLTRSLVGAVLNLTGATSKKTIRNVDGTLWLTYVSDIFADNPSAYWRLDDSGAVAVDAITGTYTGTLHGGITKGVAGSLAGDSDTAMALDGTSGTFIDGPGLGIPTAWTMECWVKPNGSSQQIDSALFTDVLVNSTVSYSLTAKFSTATDTDLQVRAAIFNGNSWTYTPAITLTVGVWQHVAATWDGIVMTIYLNGISGGTVNYP